MKLWKELRRVSKSVNHELREAHRQGGEGSTSSFSMDHSDGKFPVFMNPRTMSDRQ